MFRMFWTLIVSILLLVAIAYLAPQQLEVSLYKVSLVTIAAVAGYWIDRELFPYSRPDTFIVVDEPEPEADKVKPADPPGTDGVLVSSIPMTWSAFDLLFAAAQLRRAIIVGCAMLAIGLGA